LGKYFGSGVNPKDFDAFMCAKAQPEIEAAVRKMLKQKIKNVRISRQPLRPSQRLKASDFVDVKFLERADDDGIDANEK
jgi:hypothetical protein